MFLNGFEDTESLGEIIVPNRRVVFRHLSRLYDKALKSPYNLQTVEPPFVGCPR
jgi:hypothetical protein